MTEAALRLGGSARRWSRVRRRAGDNLVAYAFLSGALVCFGFFSWYPLLYGIRLSFEKNNFAGQSSWVGLQNYRTLWNNPLFLTAWENTLKFTLFALLFGAAVPFITAVLLNELRHFKGYLRVAVYIPVMLPPLVVTLLWKSFYDPSSGLFNSVLRTLHLPTSLWYESTSSNAAIMSLILLATWGGMGGATIVYLAALQGIPGELYEAAEIDGASLRQRVRHVTLPQMRFVILVMVLLQIVATMQLFIQVYVLTGTTDPATVSVLVLIYQYAFQTTHDFGVAAALSVMLFIFLGAISAVYLRVTRTRD
jgi:multiple sugar transport system permease protein